MRIRRVRHELLFSNDLNNFLLEVHIMKCFFFSELDIILGQKHNVRPKHTIGSIAGEQERELLGSAETQESEPTQPSIIQSNEE